jgi:hypothetical protein
MNTARDTTIKISRYRDDKIFYGDIIWFYSLQAHPTA